jgi:hypothetical protein
MTVAVATVEPAVLTNCEIRSFPLGNLAIGPGQRGPNERTMHRPFVVRLCIHSCLGLALGFGFADVDVGFAGFDGGTIFDQIERRLERLVDHDGGFGIRHRWTCKCGRFSTRAHEGRLGLLAPRRGHFGLLIFVVRVAGGAACLLHLVFDHRDDRMIRDAALARTVVVQNVTEPNPALLHELPRSDAFRVGRVKSDVKAHFSLAESPQT